jgi:glucose-1-phosphate adenylyltransferase
MDYGPLIAFHKETGADITIGGVQVPLAQAHEFGVMSLGADHRVVSFGEKPKDPQPMPGREGVALASMGIYVINPEFLRETLQRHAADPESRHDFGRSIIPAAVANRRVFAYAFEDVETKAQRYWRDVGTVDGYYNANMELIHVSPELNLYDEEWPIWTYQEQVPGAKFILDEDGRRGLAINSMISGGCIISGALVRESLLHTSVVIDEGSEVFRSVVLPRVEIGRGCYVQNAIIDEGCNIPHGTVIGRNHQADSQHFHVTDNGVVLVTRAMLTALRRGPSR